MCVQYAVFAGVQYRITLVPNKNVRGKIVVNIKNQNQEMGDIVFQEYGIFLLHQTTVLPGV